MKPPSKYHIKTSIINYAYYCEPMAYNNNRHNDSALYHPIYYNLNN